MRALDEIERAIELIHIFQEDVQIEGQGLGYPIFGVVSGEIVVPLPRFAIKRRLDIDFGLLNIQFRAKQLLGRFDQAGVM